MLIAEMIELLKVLIAHPAEEFTRTLTRCLQTEYAVSVCHTGPEAIQAIDAWWPDVLVLYLSMPIVTGFEVLQAVSYRPGIIVAITNIFVPEVLREAADAGAQAVFPSPCSCRAIRERIDDLIREHGIPV